MNHGMVSKTLECYDTTPTTSSPSLGYQVPVTCVEPRPLDLRRVAMRLRWSAETAARGARPKCIQIALAFFRNFWH